MNSRKKLKSIFANDRLRVSVTDTCNLTCVYCSNEGQYHNQKKYLNAEWYLGFITKLEAEGVYIKKLNITGGEPFMHPQLNTILSASIRVADEVTLNTNGLLLTHKKINELHALGVKNIKFGVDWLFGSVIKPSKNKPRYNQKQYIDNILYAIEIMPRTSLNVVMSEFNANRIFEMIDFVINNKIDKVEFLEIIEHDFRNNRNLSKRVLKAKDMVERLTNKFKRIEYNVKLAKYMCFLDNGLMLQFAEDFCNRKVCQNLWTRMDAKGHISPCIKGKDSYPIEIEKDLIGQLIKLNELMCNRHIGHFPRGKLGEVEINTYKETESSNSDELLFNNLVVFSERDP